MAFPPCGKPSWSIVPPVSVRGTAEPVEGEPANRGVPACEEPFADRQPERARCRPRPRSGRLGRFQSPRKTPGDPEACAGRHDDPRNPRHRPIRGARHEALRETDFRAHLPGRHLGLESEERAEGRIDRIVPRVQHPARGERRQSHVGEQTIDDVLVLAIQLSIGRVVVAEPVPDRRTRRHPGRPRQLRRHPAAEEVEPRANRLPPRTRRPARPSPGRSPAARGRWRARGTR